MYVPQTDCSEENKVFTLCCFCIHLIPCCPPLEGRDECHRWDLTLGNYYQYSRYTMARLAWVSLDLLHSLCILKLSWDCINPIACCLWQGRASADELLLPLSGPCWKRESRCVCLHCSCSFLPPRPAGICWQPVLFVSVRRIGQRAALGCMRGMWALK